MALLLAVLFCSLRSGEWVVVSGVLLLLACELAFDAELPKLVRSNELAGSVADDSL